MNRRPGVLGAAAIVLVTVAAAFAFSPAAFAAGNSGCLLCHDSAMSMSVPDVDLVTLEACKACHIPGFVGSHPYHQPGANCGAACHPGWGDSLPTAIPAFNDPSGASFASALSASTAPAVLHIIHAAPRWPANVSASFSECGSCHQSAACNACHAGAVDASHATHSATGSPASTPPLAAYPDWTGTVGRGVTGVDQTVNTVSTESNQCASAGCHDLEGTKLNRPGITEDYNHAVGGNPEDPTVSNSAITLVGTWRIRYHAVYTGARASYSNALGSQLNADFNGTRVEVVSDKDPYRGKAEVWIDGVKEAALIDCYAASTSSGAIVFTKDGLTAGNHTISIRPLNQKRTEARATFVLVDGFNVYSELPASISPPCLSCHPTQSTDHGGNFDHEASQTAGVYPGPANFSCPSCHSLNMFAEHGRASSKTDAQGCSACHQVYADFSLNEFNNPARTGYGSCTWAGDGVKPGCHQVAGGDEPHNFDESNHDASSTGAGTSDCRGCHGNDLSVIHDDTNVTRLQHTSLTDTWPTSCLTCHGTDPTYPTTKD
ncbi:hypothetical protein EG835_03925, partial [bacterium]|nr:hypothetical protein [bacterium]